MPQAGSPHTASITRPRRGPLVTCRSAGMSTTDFQNRPRSPASERRRLVPVAMPSRAGLGDLAHLVEPLEDGVRAPP